MRKLLLFLTAAMPIALHAQSGGFESQPLPTADTYYVNYTRPGADVGFNEIGVHFPCVYDTGFGASFWNYGFAYSNKHDSVTSGYLNQYSAKPAKGNNGSSKYVVAYGMSNSVGRLVNTPWQSMYVTNSTYAYNSMRDGDFFAKKFGGATGNDPDWFKLTIHGYRNTVPLQDSIEFYLADFRFANHAQDYIVKDWQRISLTPLAAADSLIFSLSSSDVGAFGMNTPAYFCLDDISLHNLSVATRSFDEAASISPNPVSAFLRLDVSDASVRNACIMDMAGRIIAAVPVTSRSIVIETGHLPAGRYLLKLDGKDGGATTTFIRQ